MYLLVNGLTLFPVTNATFSCSASKDEAGRAGVTVVDDELMGEYDTKP